MDRAESFSTSRETSISTTPWETIRDNYKQPEYQTLFNEVPQWGQDFLRDLYDYHVDSFTHSLRTSLIVKRILERSTMTGHAAIPHPGEIPHTKIRLGALLHDVGKRQVPREILDKPDKPTDEEWGELQKHPENGYHAIKPHDEVVATLVGGHHLYQGERSYGPKEAAPMSEDMTAAQHIIAVADVVDAMAGIRPEHGPRHPDVVHNRMLQEGNFSPNLIAYAVDAYLHVNASFRNEGLK